MVDTSRWSSQYTVVALCTMAFLSTMVARVVISPVVSDLTDAFEATTGSIGLALSGMWAAYALTQFPSGVLADRHGERLVILSAIGATGVASLLLSLSQSYLVFFVFAVALGGAAGLVYSAATSLVTKQTAETGRAIGIYLAGGPIAGLLAPPLAAAVAVQYDWRAAVALGVVAAVPVFVLFWWGVDPTPPARPDQSIADHLDIDTFVELLSRPPIVSTVVLAVFGAFTWQATASFLPVFLETFHGYTRTTASLLFSMYFVVHGLTQPLTGGLSDRFSRNAAASLCMSVGVLGYGLLLVGSAQVVVVAAVGMIGLAMSWGAPLQSKFMDNLSEPEQGTGFGLVRTVYMSVGALGSVVTGVLVDVAGWVAAFGLLVALMGVGALMLVTGLVSRRVS